MTFELLRWTVFAVTALAFVAAYARTRDPFHPLILCLPFFAFLYWWMPGVLSRSHEFDSYFTPEQLVMVQGINVCGTVAFVAGCFPYRNGKSVWPASLALVRPVRLWQGAALLGVLSVLASAYMIRNVGGLRAAYGSAYGGGWSEIGYIRDATLLGYVAIPMLALAEKSLPNRRQWLYIGIGAIAMPFVLQGLLGARRGPTFMITVVLALTWYLLRGERPALWTVGLSGAALGTFLVILVANRDRIYLGSNFDLDLDKQSYITSVDTGNEYMYGSAAIVEVEENDTFFWGRRYFANLFIRPIPSFLWRDKYRDIGLPELLNNAGTSGRGLESGEQWRSFWWKPAGGSAPGIIADMWVEFRWVTFLALVLFGRLFALAWSRAVTRGGIYAVQYVVVAALSIFFVMQTFEAAVVRSLTILLPMWAVYRWAKYTPPQTWRMAA